MRPGLHVAVGFLVFPFCGGWHGQRAGREDLAGHRLRGEVDGAERGAGQAAQVRDQERGSLAADGRGGNRGEVPARDQGLRALRRDQEQAGGDDHLHGPRGQGVRGDPRGVHQRSLPGEHLRGLQVGGAQGDPRRPEEAPRGLQGQAAGREARGRRRSRRGGRRGGRGGVVVTHLMLLMGGPQGPPVL